ncbi:MAG: type II toxin-antitoxin system RelE/ParE family toxin [Rhizobiaceae bacterium]
MILSFRSRALKRFFEKSDGRGLNPQHLRKIELVLGLLDEANSPEQMNLAKLDFHKLSGENPSRWSVHINGNWCITFSFEGEDALAIDYEDYH